MLAKHRVLFAQQREQALARALAVAQRKVAAGVERLALGGAGPRDVSTNDALGGQTLWTTSAEFRFPLPLPSELGFVGRAFIDAGANYGLPSNVNDTGCPTTFPNCVRNDSTPRVGAGVGISWRSPIGLINIAEELHGVQIGVINIARNKSSFRVLPLVNYSR